MEFNSCRISIKKLDLFIINQQLIIIGSFIHHFLQNIIKNSQMNKLRKLIMLCNND